MRKLKFRCAMGISYLRMSPGTAMEAMCPYITPTVFKKGIQLLDPNPNTRAAFVGAMGDALDLIALKNPLIFKRVTTEIRRIYHLPSYSGADYTRRLKICNMDLSKLGSTLIDEEDKRIFLACVLIHEATHGHLYSRGIYQSKANIQRVEEICCKQMSKFARSVDFPEFPFKGYQAPSFSERLKVYKKDIRKMLDGKW